MHGTYRIVQRIRCFFTTPVQSSNNWSNFERVEIKWYQIDASGQEKSSFNTKLDNVKVVAVGPVMHNIKDPARERYNHLERVELRYEKITWTYKDGNIIHSDSWNESRA